MGAAAAVVDDSGAPGVGSGATCEDQLSLARPAARDAKASLSRPESRACEKSGGPECNIAGPARRLCSAHSKRVGAAQAYRESRFAPPPASGGYLLDVQRTPPFAHRSQAPAHPRAFAFRGENQKRGDATPLRRSARRLWPSPAPTPERRRPPCPPVGQPLTRSGMALPPSAVGDPLCFAPRDGGERARQPAQPRPRVKCGGFPIVSVAAGGV